MYRYNIDIPWYSNHCGVFFYSDVLITCSDLPKVIQGEQVIQRRAASAGENSRERCHVQLICLDAVIWRCLKWDGLDVMLGNAMKWVAQTRDYQLLKCRFLPWSPVLFATFWFGRFISFIDLSFHRHGILQSIVGVFRRNRRTIQPVDILLMKAYYYVPFCWIYSSTRASTIIHYSRASF